MKKAFQEDKAWIRLEKKQSRNEEEMHQSEVVLSSAVEMISPTSTKLSTTAVLVVLRLHVVSGLQRRKLPAAGARSSAGLQPRLAGVGTQLAAPDLPQHLAEHRQVLAAPPQPGRQHGGLQVQLGPPDKQAPAGLGPQHRRLPLQPGPTHQPTQTQLHPQRGRLQAERRARGGAA